jgi:hypothetical protein
LDMPSDKITASPSRTSLKSIEMPISDLNCVEFTMKQEPSQILSRQIKRKRKRAFK